MPVCPRQADEEEPESPAFLALPPAHSAAQQGGALSGDPGHGFLHRGGRDSEQCPCTVPVNAVLSCARGCGVGCLSMQLGQWVHSSK